MQITESLADKIKKEMASLVWSHEKDECQLSATEVWKNSQLRKKKGRVKCQRQCRKKSWIMKQLLERVGRQKKL